MGHHIGFTGIAFQSLAVSVEGGTFSSGISGQDGIADPFNNLLNVLVTARTSSFKDFHFASSYAPKIKTCIVANPENMSFLTRLYLNMIGHCHCSHDDRYTGRFPQCLYSWRVCHTKCRWCIHPHLGMERAEITHQSLEVWFVKWVDNLHFS